MTNEQKFLTELIIDDVARYLIEDTSVSVIEALDIVYHSQFYDKLMDLETGLYYQSPAYCYEYLKHELKYGKAVQIILSPNNFLVDEMDERSFILFSYLSVVKY